MDSRCFTAASRRPDLFGAFPFSRFFIMVQDSRGPALPAPGLLQQKKTMNKTPIYTKQHHRYRAEIQSYKIKRRKIEWKTTPITQVEFQLIIAMDQMKQLAKDRSFKTLPQQFLRGNSSSFNDILGRQPLHCPARITSHRWVDFYQLHTIFFTSISHAIMSNKLTE
jgi:hypothetical protein